MIYNRKKNGVYWMIISSTASLSVIQLVYYFNFLKLWKKSVNVNANIIYKVCNPVIMEEFISTRAAQIKNNAEILHVLTTYETPKKIIHPTQKNEHSIVRNDTKMGGNDEDICVDDEPIDEKKKQELEMKKYRYDIIKFGMAGLRRTQVRQAKIELAISLGAKPPKNKSKNYKKLIEQRKREKIQEKNKEKFTSGFNTNQLRKNKKKTFISNQKKKKGSEILEEYGKITKDYKQKQKSSGQKRREKK